MSRPREMRRRMRAALQAIEDLDGALAAGRLAPDEHGRRRAEHEREAGRLLASLHQARGPAARPQAAALLATPGGRTRLRSPLAIVGAGAVLLLAGVGGGMATSRWLDPGRRTAPPVPAPTVVSQPDLRSLLPSAVPASAPISALLEQAHGALDQGRLDEARAIYTRILAREPRNVEAITHLGAVLYQEQRVGEAVAKVDEALRIDPRYVHALWDRTQYLFHGTRDFAAATRAGEAFLEVAPEGPDADSVRALMQEARARVARERAVPR